MPITETFFNSRMPLFENFRKLFTRRQEIRMPRRWPRIVMTDTSIVTMPGERREPIKLTNLSAGGARVRSSFPLPVRERVTLQVALAAGARHNLPAQVIYCHRDPQGLHYFGGLSFVGSDREGISEIAAFIEAEQRRRFGARDAWRG